MGEPNYWRETGVSGPELLELVCNILLFMSRARTGSSKGPSGRLAGEALRPAAADELLSLQMLAGCFNISKTTASRGQLFFLPAGSQHCFYTIRPQHPPRYNPSIHPSIQLLHIGV